jgi:hypothetical protein
MGHMPPIPSPPTAIQAILQLQDILEVVVLRDRMDRIVNNVKWIVKLVCVHSCCSVCNTNEGDGNVSVCKCI